MSSTIKLGDDFMKIPKLEEAGMNWVIYKTRFLWSIDARGYLDHVDGSAVTPPDPITRASPSPPMPQVLTAAEVVLDTAWRKELKIWNQGEAIVKQQIAVTISDSHFLKIRGKTTAYEIWEALVGDFENKSRMVSVDLRRRLQLERCAEKGDVRAHFTKMHTMCEDLAAMGQPPSDDDFYAIVMGSLPSSYDPYISTVNATSSVLSTTLTAENLMHTVTEEFDRRSLGSKGAKREENAAFFSNDSAQGSGSGGRGRRFGAGSSSRKNVECYNCKKKGHFKSECWAEGSGKASQGPKGKGKEKEKEGKGKGKEMAASAKDDDDEEGWMAMTSSDEEYDAISDGDISSVPSFALSDDDLMDFVFDGSEYGSDDPPNLEPVSDSDSDSNSVPDLQEVSNLESDDDDEEYERVYAPTSWLVNALNQADEAYTSHTSTTLANEHGLIDMDLYDSGAWVPPPLHQLC
ncbi:hypothetical protein CVT25_004305 [Psilocybe cyanescens]|uniref:CCHC-type domain-containing protein n=1 Tax=Psilocybe cyanescens TaxID=93625 RepID=A0A409W1Y8_PSICY|nr:hypothetical protein CVT25_004305 [Psilocybe cyanescens]